MLESIMGEPKLVFEIPDNVDLSYATTFQEPTYYDGVFARAMEPVSKCMSVTHDGLQVATYYILKVTFGVCLTIGWGIAFGIWNFILVYFANPCLKGLFPVCRFFLAFAKVSIRMCCDAVFESMAIMFTRIRGIKNVKIDKVEPSIECQATTLTCINSGMLHLQEGFGEKALLNFSLTSTFSIFCFVNWYFVATPQLLHLCKH